MCARDMMSYEEEKKCPLCAEEMDWTDQQLKPCKCGYQVCVWCWHQIMDMAEKDETEGRCPACRAPYDKNKIVGTEAKFERVLTNTANRKHKPPKSTPKTNEVRKDLTNIRVIQRRMTYVTGLPLSLADEDLLKRKEYFGQYGKVTKVCLSRTSGGVVQQFVNDTCSVYVTFSKEEEAIRCIQAVHSFVLDGNFLKASFGTAKYCHQWLRNLPCSNSACLYLHSLGAEEDSFSKEEAAAAKTRSIVQQIVGATHNLQGRSGNMLPPPIDGHFNYSSASTEKPVSKSDPKGVAPLTATSNGQLTNISKSKDKDGGARAPNKMATFVDIVGRSSSLNCPVMDNHVEEPMNKEFKEPFREPSNVWGFGRDDVTTPSDVYSEEQSSSILDIGKQQTLDGPLSVAGDDLLSIDDGRFEDSGSQTAPLIPSSHPLMTLEDSSSIHVWGHGESRNQSEYSLGLNTVNDNVDVASIMNDGYNEKKFQSSAKSDRVYKCSNSFSSEEIVEHLRRLEDDDDRNNDAQNPALEALESSIISNIMSLDLDDNDDTLARRPGVAGLFDQTSGPQIFSWNPYNSDQSAFSLAKQDGFANQRSDLDYSFSDIGRDLKKRSAPQYSGENKEQYSSKPQYLVSRAQGPTPPGFSHPSREPTPGFPAYGRTDRGFHANSSSHMVKNSSFSKSHYRTPSTGNSSNTSDIDIIDPAIMVVGRGSKPPPNGLTSNSYFDMRSTYASQPPSAFNEEARLWLLMQHQPAPPAHQDFNYHPQTNNISQATPPAHRELRYSGQTGNGHPYWDNNMYGVPPGYLDQHQTYNNNPSSYNNTQFSQQKFGNGNFSNDYCQPGLGEMRLRNEGMAELQRNEELGYNNFYSGYGDYMLQPGSGDLYNNSSGVFRL